MHRELVAGTRRAPDRTVIPVFRLLSAGTVASLAALALLHLLERVALVAIAVGFVNQRGHTAIEASIGLALLMAFRSALRGATARGCRATLARTTVGRLLCADVLYSPLPADEPVAATFDAIFAAQQILVDVGPSLLGDASASLLALAALALWPVAGLRDSLPLVLPAVALAAVVLGFVYSTTGRLTLASHRAFGRVYTDITTVLGGRLDLVSSGRERTVEEDVRAHVDQWRRVAARSDLLSALAGRLPILAALAGAALFLASTDSLRSPFGSNTLANAALVGSIAPAFIGAVRNALLIASGSPRVRPLVALLATRDGPRGRPGAVDLPALPADIQVRDVSFSYETPSSPPVLRGLSLHWRAGHSLALVGANGAGKSTVLRLLLGLVAPQRGDVRLGEVNLFDRDLSSWRRSVAYLPQRPYLGEDTTTVLEAIRLLARDVSDAEATQALDRVDLLPALLRVFPDRPLSVPTRALSAGQRQRLALARTLCQRCPVILLDEPDANLDAGGVALLRTLLRELSKTAMVAFVAHSDHLTHVADQILHVEHGQAAERGAPEPSMATADPQVSRGT